MDHREQLDALHWHELETGSKDERPQATESWSERLRSLRLCRTLRQVGIQDISIENTLIYVPVQIYKNAVPPLLTHMIISPHSSFLQSEPQQPWLTFPIYVLGCDSVSFYIVVVNQGNILK